MNATTWRFGLLALGVWVSFLIFGFTQEHLTRHRYGESGEKFTHTQALVVAQSLGNVLVAGTAIYMQKHEHGKNKWTAGVPIKDWLIVAVSYFLAHSLGLASLKYIIFPLQVVIKSCKSVPVMLGEVVFARVKPTIAKTVGVVVLSIGVALFTLSTEEEKKSHSGRDNSHMVYGVTLAGTALIFDAIYGPYQNKIVENWKPSSWSLMFNMNLYELIIAVVYDLFTSTELQETVAFWEKYPIEFGYRVVLFCISMSIGNIFIYKIQREFGALAVTKTTTVRKLVSLAISIVWFGHALGMIHYAAMTMVFAAPILEKRVHKWEIARHTKVVGSSKGKKMK